jgi:hypothetical protein
MAEVHVLLLGVIILNWIEARAHSLPPPRLTMGRMRIKENGCDALLYLELKKGPSLRGLV